MISPPALEIIHSATPLETRFCGVHPRLYATAEDIDALRAKCHHEPWASFLQRVCKLADRRVDAPLPEALTTGDVRGVGCGLAHLAIAYRFTRTPRYLESALAYLDGMCRIADWTASLQFGHWSHGMAVAYDWLYDHLGEARRATVRQTLLNRASGVAEKWASYRNLYPTGYAWNHSGVVHNGIMSAGCALFGDTPGAAALIQLSLEKLRLMVAALGDDGASAEGLAYGQYHVDFHIKSLIFADQLLGENFFDDHLFLRHFPRFLIHSMLPQDAWKPDGMFMQFGDSDGPHWYGPDSHLRVVASRYRDGHAQWLADAVSHAGTAGETSCFLNLLFHDETVVPVTPDALPTERHFADKDIVLMRSGWQDGATLLGIKCGPASGHHAARRYRNNVGGGHMHPDAGHLLLFAGGDWLLYDAGYSQKFTSYRNTFVVNGIGQTGEGGVWFEDLDIRRGKPEGRLLRVESTGKTTMVIADPAPAYEPAAGVQRFLRHLLYIKPGTCILVDELSTLNPARFEQRFHSPGGFSSPDGVNWIARGQNKALWLMPIGPSPLQAQAGTEPVLDCPGNGPASRQIETLLVSNPEPASKLIWITVLQVVPLDAPMPGQATLEKAGHQFNLSVPFENHTASIRITPGQTNASDSVFDTACVDRSILN